MEEITVLVKIGEDLPKINKKLYTNSPLTNKTYEVTIKKILDLRWNKNGDLIVVVSGSKKEFKA
jgi:hypothetical protein